MEGYCANFSLKNLIEDCGLRPQYEQRSLENKTQERARRCSVTLALFWAVDQKLPELSAD